MNKFKAISCMTVLIFVCGLLTRALHAQERDEDFSASVERSVSAEDAAALEEGLKSRPDNFTARQILITYYFEAQLKSRTPELEEKREEHIFWLIENHPEAGAAGSPEAEILPMRSDGSSRGYERGKQLWLEQVEKHPDNKWILKNASSFLLLTDRKTARELLEKALALAPNDTDVSSRLAQTYDLERIAPKSTEERATLAQKSLSIRERGLEKADGELRYLQLADLAMTALDAGETTKAEQYANELLQAAKKSEYSWNYGNAVHKGNIVLGRVALQRGDIVGAKQHLIDAGGTPGSPQLDSFGPNMTLAKELLEKGERETVLTYLQSCGKFWKMGDSKLQNWIATVRGGGMPNFGANLSY